MAKLKETSVAGNLTVTGEVDATTGFRWGGQSLDERYDNRYINASGDTMTGNLVIASAATLTIDKGANFDWLGTTISSVIDLDDYNSTVMLNNYNAGSNFTNRPTGTDYGSVIAFGGGYANISLQLFNDINHSNSDGSELYFRALNGTGWHTWSKILTDLNFDSVTGGPYLPLTGGTLTGALVLPGDPGADDEAARKKYVDDEVSNHTHLEIDITDLDKYTQAEVDALVAGAKMPDGTLDGQLLRWESDTASWDGISDVVVDDNGALLIGNTSSTHMSTADAMNLVVLGNIAITDIDLPSSTIASRMVGTLEARPPRHSVKILADSGYDGDAITDANGYFPNVSGEADVAGFDNHTLFTYADVVTALDGVGGRLPTLEELRAGAGKGSGQSYDTEYLWTQTKAGHNKVWVAAGSDTDAKEPIAVSLTDSYRARVFWDVSKANLSVYYDNSGRLRTKELRAEHTDGLKLFGEAGDGIFVEDTGNVGIKNVAPSVELDVTGSINASTDITAVNEVQAGSHLLTNKTDLGHTHVEIDITDLDKYTQNEIDSSQATQDNRLTTLEADTHPGRTDNPHGVTAVQVDAYTQSQVDSLISGIDVGGVSTDSNNLAELGTDSKIWVPSTKVPIPVWEKNFNDETFTSYEFLGIEPNHDYKLIVSGFVGDTNFATDLNLQFITANGLEDSTKYRFMTLMAGSGPGNNEVYSGYYSSQDHFLLMKLAYTFGCAGEFLVGLSQNMIKSSAINGQSSSWETGGGYHTLTIGGFYIDSLGTLPVTGLRLSRGTTTSTTVKTGRLQWIRMPRM
jgi:hypothetical protein